MDLSLMRDEFEKAGLHRSDLNLDPVKQFARWFEDAQQAGYRMPNAVTLATVGPDGQPSIRIVLLKMFDEKGFVFYTNYGSRKASEMALNPKVALHFPWHDLERQVIITGSVEKVSTAESLKYFLTRPKGSQIGAWVSNQSSVISSRQALMMKFEEMKQKFEHQEVPLPSFWGGFRVVPSKFEFWQGQKSRLHDRFQYTQGEAGEWVIERLAP
ncbi:MAG: pyridoxamine 5'-phosphate oxidase [Saprospiraceae bacterium]|nr:pyridoxamine 5'-phosphate oxidase [Saprospiraceae bacterium]MCF8252584.1 pyridoxamine 5'-phosphate oxidase [Saprospiraceae bacterium]MCF8282625.1 pyridoxamine 5'-phosphate oxidase [Bacteroidales bacterium]MCF8314170.1 pyridoxamine 5'-phosphate oxidase [Saprospiraceae bacterium]MCF8442936.1 pyridoxamine 5'-phosphate oxidase [Saprospiraceae bacterium]